MTLMLLEWVFTSVFLILVVLGLRAALGRRISARLRYALWAVVLVRLLVPVQLFTSPLAGTWVITETRTEEHVYTPVNREEQFHPDGPTIVLDTKGEVDNGPVLSAPSVPNLPDAPAAPEPPAAPDLTKAPAWLGWVWLGGAAAAALVMLASNLRFARRLRRCRARLEAADCPLPVYAAVGLPSPCLFGVLRPAVYVTPEAAADPAMLRHVTAHEYTHFRQGDHIWSFLRCAALAVHWWNPLVWLAVELSRRDGELACDEGALRLLGDGERAAYGNTLLALVTAKPRPGDLLCFATTMAGDKKSLKERITRIARAPRRWLWAAVAVVLVTALACVCAFGQKAAADDPEPDPDSTVEPSAGPSEPPAESWDIEGDDVEIAFKHTAVNPESSFGVPADVLEAAKTYAAQRFRQDAPEGIMIPGHGEYNEETERWDWVEDPDHAAHFDRVRIENMDGPWLKTCRDIDIEIWRINYEYHTTTPEEAEEVLVGGMYLTEDGWLCPTYSNCTYLFFPAEGEARSLLTVAMLNTYGPDSEEFIEEIESILFPEPERVEPPEDAFAPGSTAIHMFYEPDLNRNGIPERVVTEGIYDDPENYGNREAIVGQRIGVFEDDELIWWDEGYNSHAGWNAIFSCTIDGEDYLLRYNPTMYQGMCEYSYKLFTLEGSRETTVEQGYVLESGRETTVEQDYVSFDTNLGTAVFTGEFDPEAIGAFMERVNWLLERSTIRMITDQDLIGSIRANNEPGLRDDLWWLDRAPVFVRDESKSLTENLRAFRDTFVGGELAAFGPVLLSDQPFTLVSDKDGKPTQTKKFLSDFDVVEQFATVWTRDGGYAVVVKFTYPHNGSEGVTFLYQKDGVVYGPELVFDGLGPVYSRAYDVKIDGTMVVHDSPGMAAKAMAIDTAQGCFRAEVVQAGDPDIPETWAYYVDGEPATEEEYRAALEWEMSRPNAVWYDLTEENIHAVFG